MGWLNDIAELIAPGITYSGIVRVETALVAAALVVAVVRPSLGVRTFERIERALRSLAERPGRAIFAVAAFALLLRLALLPVAPVPVPGTHDEFSYLLAADTYAHGRLANPPHPMWIFFESFHIIHHPTYASMYPPVQGFILMVGQLLGHPWIGMLLAVAFMCGALTWMLQGWTTPGWSLLGGGLGVLKLATFGHWINSYWGGAHAAIGGALALGALGRMRRERRPRYALLFAAGVAVMVNSRPMEGTVVTIASVVALTYWMVRGAIPLREGWRGIVLPGAAAAAVVAALMGYFNWRVFGSPLTLPYTVNRAMYAVTPMFLFEPLKPAPTYHHEVMKEFFLGWEPDNYRYVRTVYGYRHALLDKYKRIEAFYLGPALLFPLIACPLVFLDRRIRAAIAVGAALIGVELLEVWLFPHWMSPITGIILLVVVEALRRLRAWRPRGREAGLFLSRALPVICAAMVLTVAAVRASGVEPRSAAGWEIIPPDAGLRDRAAIIDRLSRTGRRHLMIVRYAPGHDVHQEWVYNGADIDGSPVVWAREMDPAATRTLIDYYKDRDVWLVQPDIKPVVPTPYPR